MSFETITFSFGVDAEEEIPTGISDRTDDLFDVDFCPSLAQIAEWLRHLDGTPIQETIRLKSSQQVRCCACGTENLGKVLDESKILLPFPKGAFHGRTDLMSNIYPRQGGSGVYSLVTGPRVTDDAHGRGDTLMSGAKAADSRRYASYTRYMIKQDIVRSGLFSEEQLRGANGRYSKWLSRHDLEVNALAFHLVRPVSCITCRSIPLSGLSPHWGVLYGRGNHDLPARVAELPTVQTVDDLHSVGERIRTGFRIRSRAARLRRRYKKVKTTYCFHGSCLFDQTLAVPVKLLYTPPRRQKRPQLSGLAHRKKVRRTVYQVSPVSYGGRLVLDQRPMGHHWKYWYFLRKRGAFYTSAHHPYVDDKYYFHGSKEGGSFRHARAAPRTVNR